MPGYLGPSLSHATQLYPRIPISRVILEFPECGKGPLWFSSAIKLNPLTSLWKFRSRSAILMMVFRINLQATPASPASRSSRCDCSGPKRSFQQGTNNRFLCQLQVPQHFVSNTNCDHCTCAIHSNSTCFNRTQSVPVWVNLQRHLELKVLRTWGDTFPSSRPATLLSACALLLLDLVVSLAWKAGKGEEVYTAQTCLHWNKVPTQ